MSKKHTKLYSIAFFSILIAFFTMLIGFFRGTPSEPTDPPTTEIVYVIPGTTDPSSEDETTTSPTVPAEPSVTHSTFSYELVSEYSGEAYCIINNNIPYFEPSEYTTSSFEIYSSFDSFGRCGVAYANICQDLMPTESREGIGSVKPTGWTYNGKSNNNKYDFVDGKYIYNRCHLIGFQLAGENANEKNLITGTRYLNVTGMLPFENMVADYVKATDNHVLYRITPVFINNELLCRGLLMEAYSVEDNGDGIEFCVWCYNVQPGVEINYATGQNWLTGTTTTTEAEVVGYVVNDNSMKFHNISCKYASTVSANQRYVSQSRDTLIKEGYVPCKVCNP